MKTKIHQTEGYYSLALCITAIITLIILSISASSSAYSQKEWTRYDGNPVLVPGPSGSWDSQCVEHSVVLFTGSIYHMWYAGYDGIHYRIGHATSTDGISWTKDPQNPVLDVGDLGSWDSKYVYLPSVIIRDSEFHMWYAGRSANIEKIGHATSSDGINWTKDTQNPVLDIGDPGSWEDEEVFTMPGSVLFDGDIFKMWYGGKSSETSVYATGYATSVDGSDWNKDPSNPIMEGSPPGNFDWYTVIPGTVLYDGDTYQIWYGGSGIDYRYRIGYATSSDGIEWDKNTAQNPVLDFGAAGSWDFTQVWSGSVLFDSTAQIYRMWYTGGTFHEGQIGYATSLTSGVNNQFQPDPSLHPIQIQNNPNPFDAATAIEYKINEPGRVELRIYNHLGKLVTVTAESKPQGNHVFVWNTENLPNGIYYCRLLAGGQVSTAKMIKAEVSK